MFWGPLGDGFGRKSVLAITILLMSGATACIGLIPSYASIGFWAPVLLVVLRMMQGFSTGGEYGGAATFMAEHAPDSKRGFCGSFLEFGTLGGFSLGALLMLGASLTLGDKAMHEWGWRLPYLIAAPMGLVGWYLRSRIDDTPVFREIEDERCASASNDDRASRSLFRATRGRCSRLAVSLSPSTSSTTLCSAICRPISATQLGLTHGRGPFRAHHRHAAHDAVSAFDGRAFGQARPQAAVVVLAHRPHRHGRADV